jgi:hypothetical protein
VTGEIVQRTRRRERFWNYLGSIPHWLYITALRAHRVMWSWLVWWLSLAALSAALAGMTIGIARIQSVGAHLKSPYKGWKALHNWLGLSFGIFVLTWIFSGWLSMNDRLPFSEAALSPAERAAFIGNAPWQTLSGGSIASLSSPNRDVEWFTFGGKIYRRERRTPTQQALSIVGVSDTMVSQERGFLSAAEIDAATSRFAAHMRSCFRRTPGQ